MAHAKLAVIDLFANQWVGLFFMKLHAKLAAPVFPQAAYFLDMHYKSKACVLFSVLALLVL